ncbi:hypothetical protein BHM03_00007428 [Ensete ventricosum]|nr:hypothetical protein BHM03_00007428 [Ensete ventricosum]
METLFTVTVVCREFADPVVAKATLDFLNLNKAKLLSSFPTLLPQTAHYQTVSSIGVVFAPLPPKIDR